MRLRAFPSQVPYSPQNGATAALTSQQLFRESRAGQDCRPEQGADGKGEPSHRILFRPVTGVQCLAGTANSDPVERTVQRSNSTFTGSEHRNG